MKHTVVKVNPADNVIVALRALEAGAIIDYEGERYILPRSIPEKHTFVTDELAIGASVTMYGVGPIGPLWGSRVRMVR